MTSQPVPLTFPATAAATDMGSNAIRYVVAEFSRADRFVEVGSERIAVRLGRDVFTRARRLSEETMAAETAALVQIRHRLDDLGVQHRWPVSGTRSNLLLPEQGDA